MYIFSIAETGKKTLKLKALPIVNLPKKSHDTRQIHRPARTNNLMDKHTDYSQKTKKKFYKSYGEPSTVFSTNYGHKNLITPVNKKTCLLGAFEF